MNIQYENPAYDGTLYEFYLDKTLPHNHKGMVRASLRETSTTFDFNKGAFDYCDVPGVNGNMHAWDLWKLAKKDRQDMRVYYGQVKRPISVGDFLSARGVSFTAKPLEGRREYEMKTVDNTDPQPQAFFIQASEMLDVIPVPSYNEIYPAVTSNSFSFGNIVPGHIYEAPATTRENPMYAKTTVAAPTAQASAVIQTKSDAQLQREYLLDRLNESVGYYGSTESAFRKKARDFFHMDTDNRPKTAQALIDAITGGKYKLDETKLKLIERFGGEYDPETDEYVPDNDPFWAITFDGPVRDRKGYEQALTDFSAEVTKTRDTIMIADPTKGLAALQSLETWTPKSMNS